MDQDAEHQKNDLLRRAALGREVEEFWRSNVGKYLQQRALEQYTSAVDEFKSVNVHDVTAVQVIQNKMKIAEEVLDWIGFVIDEGLRSLNLLEGNDSDSEA